MNPYQVQFLSGTAGNLFRQMLVVAFLLITALLGAASLLATEITLPDETARLRESPLPGYALATTYCYTCHSADYIPYQPSMTR